VGTQIKLLVEHYFWCRCSAISAFY